MPPKKKKKSLQLSPFADLTPFLCDGELVALNVGFDSQLYAVIAQNELDDRTEAPSGVNFTKTQQTYRVIALHDGSVTLDLRIAKDYKFDINDIQP